MYVCMYMYICMYICMYVDVYMYMYICIYYTYIIKTRKREKDQQAVRAWKFLNKGQVLN